MPYQTDTPTLPTHTLGPLVIASWRANRPQRGSRINWLRVGAWTTGVVLSAATWTGIAVAILALV